jgi:sugar phosphate isomerase/epimerase
VLPCLLTDTVTSDIDRSLHYTLLWGLESVELRTVGGPGDRVPFVNEAKLKRRLAELDVPVAAIVPGLFEGAANDRVEWLNEIAVFGETLQFCKRIGCGIVVVSAFLPGAGESIDSVVDALSRAGREAARQNVRIAVLNEHEMGFPTGAALADLLARVNLTNVGAAWNPVAAVRNGENPEEGLTALSGRVFLVRCTDGGLASGGWAYKPLGEGSVDWPRQLKLLHGQGFSGPLSLEVHLKPAPKTGLRDATTLIRLIRGLKT